MKITYGDLINSDVCAKLMMVSFSTPQKNLMVYRFANSLIEKQKYFENEKEKLLDKYGELQSPGRYKINGEENIAKYQEKLSDIQKIEVDSPVVDPNLSEDDFSDIFCSYPSDKRFWLNANEISQILSLSQKVKECNLEDK